MVGQHDVSCVIYHVSLVTYHLSNVTSHLSHVPVTCHLSLVFSFFFYRKKLKLIKMEKNMMTKKWTKGQSQLVEGLLSTSSPVQFRNKDCKYMYGTYNIKQYYLRKVLLLWKANGGQCALKKVSSTLFWLIIRFGSRADPVSIVVQIGSGESGVFSIQIGAMKHKLQLQLHLVQQRDYFFKKCIFYEKIATG